ncbi:MAG: NAD-dependent epimerase/dehydratase family protein [Actinomycetia bacterium]|nr:NAD-dependent epimerase/dehydratase family protein [Actinomycetes bacterium]
MARVVLVTGVSRYLGGRLARLLGQHPDVERVVGVDVIPPPDDIGNAEFVRADIRNPVIAKVIKAASVDTVVHMNVIATPVGAGGRSAMKEINVIGTMQLLAACQRAASVKQLVVKSSATVYGVSAKDPALFTEDMEAVRLPRSGFAKDSVEVEGYVRGFARRRPDVLVSMLRFANILGPGIDTPLARYLSLPVVPTVMGFDGRMQLTHEDDALAAVQAATFGEVPGTYNVSGDGVLMLSQAIARAGRVNLPLPTPFASVMRNLVRRFGYIDFTSEQIEYLKYGRGVDTSRITERLGFVTGYSTRETFDAFLLAHPLGRVLPWDAPEMPASVTTIGGAAI